MIEKKLLRSVFATLCALCAAAAHAQSSSAAEAMNRGFDVRTVPVPGGPKMSADQWRRRQLAAVDKSQKLMMEAQKLPGLLGQYLQMQAGYAGSDDVAFRMVFGQYLSWFQTFVGDYAAALGTFSIAQGAQADDAPSPLASGFQARAADEVILRLAKDRKALFFNEAHSAPLTRTLTVELLARLREQGFNYFAAETLYTTDKDLARRGYPTAASGFYAAEPICGEMIRSALRLGYTVVAYDAEDLGIGEAREKAGAESLYEQTLERDPAARLVVNAGFGHIQKSGAHLGGTSMAEHFAKVAGVDPLAIEQTMLIEHAKREQDHPWYRAAMAAGHPERPFVFVDESGKPWTLKPGKYDVSVFFPPQRVKTGRPTWPDLAGMRRPFAVDAALCKPAPSCLVEARYAGEGDDAIPADRVILDATAGMPATRDGRSQSIIYLQPGRYRLRSSDKDNHVLAESTIEIGNAETVE